MDLIFFVTAISLGVGLAMDACAVSMANGLKEPNIKVKKIVFISFMFGFFQGFMPLIGYLVGSTIVSYIDKFIPWIALIILGYLGINMIVGAIRCEKEGKCDFKPLTFKVILTQSIATSIDALSVGLTICDYNLLEAIITTAFITVITFAICVGAHFIGKKFGDKLGKRAELIGGIILLLIGIEIYVTGLFF